MQCDCVIEKGTYTPCLLHRIQTRLAAEDAFERSALLVEDGYKNGDRFAEIAAKIRAEKPDLLPHERSFRTK